MKKPTAVPSRSTSPVTAFFACDVAKDKIDLWSQIPGRDLQLEFANRTAVIETQLTLLSCLARQAGVECIVVLAEPTGRYHEALFRVARRIGLETAWVSGEAVSKFRVIETNDTGKTDIKDPRVIHTLGTIDKTLIHREFQEPYSLLREWNRIYEAADERNVEIKCTIHDELKALFPDFSLSTDFLYGKGGLALRKHFGLNPYHIVEAGKEKFSDTLRKAFPGVRRATIEQLYQDAESSVKKGLSPRHAEVMEFRLRQLFEDLERCETRKLQAKQAMENLYAEARKLDPKLPEGRKGVVSNFHLARFVAETGPLSDFPGWRNLMRFAGLNLRERQSGRFRGLTKTSKKGRSLLRKILNLIVFPLVTRRGMFGAYYHRKKDVDKMPGTKAMTAVARKLLKMLFGWYRCGQAFDQTRVFACESTYKKAA